MSKERGGHSIGRIVHPMAEKPWIWAVHGKRRTKHVLATKLTRRKMVLRPAINNHSTRPLYFYLRPRGVLLSHGCYAGELKISKSGSSA